MLEKIEKKTLVSTGREKVLYAIGDVGYNMMWSLTSAFLVLYYTDSVGLAAAFVGTMMLVVRLFDGVSDLIVGVLIDKTRTRLGRARAWILCSSVPLMLVFMATFNMPSWLGQAGQKAYAFTTFFLLTVVCMTAGNLAYHSLLPRFSLTSTDRSMVSAIRTIFALLAIVGINMVTPIALAALGGEVKQSAWTTISVIYGIIALMLIFITFLGVKEKLPVDESTAAAKTEKVSIKFALKSLLSTRYLYIAVFLFVTFNITNGAQGIGIFFARDVLGDATVFGLMSMISILPTLIIIPFVPKIFDKVGKRNAMMGGLAISFVSTGCILLNPQSIPLFLSLSLIRTIGTMPLSIAIFTLAGDVADYSYMKTGVRSDGAATAVNTFGQKLGVGLGSAILGWILAFGNYDASLAVQPESAINAMIFLMLGVPMIVFAIAFVLLLFWDLEKYTDQVQDYLSQKRQVE